MFKKIIILLVIPALILSFVACDNDSKQSDASQTASQAVNESEQPDESTESEQSEEPLSVSPSLDEDEQPDESTDSKQPESSQPVSQPDNKSKQPDETAESKQSKPAPSPTDTEKPTPSPTGTVKPPTPTKDPRPGVEAPDGSYWPKDIPTPVKGKILGGGWAPDRSFYTTDIEYKQADIDDYCVRLQSFGFAKQKTHKYGKDWPDATVYSNGRWDVIVAEENDVFDYSYVNFYPLFDVVTEGYDGQPDGWPETGDFGAA